MKWRKCLTILVTLVLATSCFSACEEETDNSFTYDYAGNKGRVVQIDLIDYITDATRWWARCDKDAIPDYDFKSFDESKVELKEILPTEEIDGFLYELSTKTINRNRQEKSTTEINTPCGRSVRITYNDGSFDLISYFSYYENESSTYLIKQACYAEFDANGGIISISWIDEYGWYTLVAANYFDTKIEPIECNVEVIEVVE